MNLSAFAIFGPGSRIDNRIDVGNCREGGNDHRQSYVVRGIDLFYLFVAVPQRSALAQARSPDNPYQCRTNLLRSVEGRQLLYLSHGQWLTLHQNHVPLGEKLDQIMTWIDLPLEKRPQFISGFQFFVSCRTRQADEPF